MNSFRSILLALIVIPAALSGTASAQYQDGGWMPRYYGNMPMMGPGGGWMHSGPIMMNPAMLSDDYIDEIGERIAERHRQMERIASEQDKAARRKLIRDHLDSMHAYRPGGADGDDNGKRSRRGSMMGPGMMGPGMMGPGMMGPGMMGPGMMGPGMMGPGMMGPGMMGPGMMHSDVLSDEYLDLLGEHMAESFERMQTIAQTDDPAKRRELLRKRFESMHGFGYGRK